MAQPATPKMPKPRKAAPIKTTGDDPSFSEPVAFEVTSIDEGSPDPASSSTTAKIKAKASEAGASVKKEAMALRDQAASRARGAASEGKDRATEALDNVARMIGDAAETVDDKVGAQYGDYTRKAADAVADFANTLKGKDVDALVKDAGDFIKKSPAVAIGAAAAVGFVIARLVKAGADEAVGTAKSDAPPPANKTTGSEG